MKYNLKKAREKAGLTQREVAEKLNTTQQQINKYENEQQQISFERAIELAKLYKVSLDYLANMDVNI